MANSWWFWPVFFHNCSSERYKTNYVACIIVVVGLRERETCQSLLGSRALSVGSRVELVLGLRFINLVVVSTITTRTTRCRCWDQLKFEP